MAPTYGLSPVLIREFLTKIEAENDSLDNINLLELCNTNPTLCGQKASSRRRLFQKLFARLKAKTAKEYFSFLEEHNVTPSFYTIENLVREQTSMPTDKPQYYANATLSTAAADDDSYDDDSSFGEMKTPSKTI